MALEVGHNTCKQFPGLTRRFPIRLCDDGIVLRPGRSYRVIVSMFVGNPAFEARFDYKDGAFVGYLFDLDGRPIDDAGSAIYIHVIRELPSAS